ncbi:hypothetical protein F2Q69_00006138 [Brassica cretica]|uniref:Uncharacterized protein n=1 Tax=Brassica cretica TaxID=69181 RepID=A0A8S9PLP4_BRACR|nr:hypothetical protein F2Q69_00006138 [Brassica cretica]
MSMLCACVLVLKEERSKQGETRTNDDGDDRNLKRNGDEERSKQGETRTNDDGDDRNLKRNGDISGLGFDAAVLVDVYVYTFMV